MPSKILIVDDTETMRLYEHMLLSGQGYELVMAENGVDVPNSSSQVRIRGNNAETVAAWNFLLQMNAGDYFELMWEVDDTSVEILTEVASAVHPAIPSVILTVTDNVSSLEV